MCIFETIERNLSTVDFTKVLPDIMIIADEVDCQLKQTIDSFLIAERGEAEMVQQKRGKVPVGLVQ